MSSLVSSIGHVYTKASDFVSGINPATLSGAIDVIVVQHKNGSLPAAVTEGTYTLPLPPHVQEQLDNRRSDRLFSLHKSLFPKKKKKKKSTLKSKSKSEKSKLKKTRRQKRKCGSKSKRGIEKAMDGSMTMADATVGSCKHPLEVVESKSLPLDSDWKAIGKLKSEAAKECLASDVSSTVGHLFEESVSASATDSKLDSQSDSGSVSDSASADDSDDDEFLVASPFYVRFGKSQLLMAKDVHVSVEVNGAKVPVPMKLGSAGEAYFVVPIKKTEQKSFDASLLTSPTKPVEVSDDVMKSLPPFSLESERAVSVDLESGSLLTPTSSVTCHVEADDTVSVSVHSGTGGLTPTSLSLATTKSSADALPLVWWTQAEAVAARRKEEGSGMSLEDGNGSDLELRALLEHFEADASSTGGLQVAVRDPTKVSALLDDTAKAAVCGERKALTVDSLKEHLQKKAAAGTGVGDSQRAAAGRKLKQSSSWFRIASMFSLFPNKKKEDDGGDTESVKEFFSKEEHCKLRKAKEKLRIQREVFGAPVEETEVRPLADASLDVEVKVIGDEKEEVISVVVDCSSLPTATAMPTPPSTPRTPMEASMGSATAELSTALNDELLCAAADGSTGLLQPPSSAQISATTSSVSSPFLGSTAATSESTPPLLSPQLSAASVGSLASVLPWAGGSPETAGIRLSVCGHLLSADSQSTASGVATQQMFDEHLVTYSQLCAEPSLLFDERLILLYSNTLYPARVALPLLISQLAFGKPLTAAALTKLANDPMFRHLRESAAGSCRQSPTPLAPIGTDSGKQEEKCSPKDASQTEAKVKTTADSKVRWFGSWFGGGAGVKLKTDAMGVSGHGDDECGATGLQLPAVESVTKATSEPQSELCPKPPPSMPLLPTRAPTHSRLRRNSFHLESESRRSRPLLRSSQSKDDSMLESEALAESAPVTGRRTAKLKQRSSSASPKKSSFCETRGRRTALWQPKSAGRIRPGADTSERKHSALGSWFSKAKRRPATSPSRSKSVNSDLHLLKKRALAAESEETEKCFIKSIYAPHSFLKAMNLKKGRNFVRFTVWSLMQGTQSVSACIYVWAAATSVVVSDVDGTITKSDVMGHVIPWFSGLSYSHSGVCKLFTDICTNGYQMLYLTSRGIGQAHVTRAYLFEAVKQFDSCEYFLPHGPVIMSPDSLLVSFTREVVRKRPQEFKVPALMAIRMLFAAESNPFFAAFGNRLTDAYSYCKVQVARARIFIINPKGDICTDNHCFHTSYRKLHDEVDLLFPANDSHFAAFNEFAYWRAPVADNLSDITEDDDDYFHEPTETQREISLSANV